MKRLLFASMFVCLVSATSAWADLVIQETMTKDGSPIQITLSAGSGHFAVRQSDGQGMIYDARHQTLYEYSKAQGSYSEMTADTMKAISAKSKKLIEQEKAQLEAQMKSLPKDQQAIMKKAIAQMEQGSKQTYRRAGTKVMVGRWSAVPVDQFVDGEQNQRLWVAPDSALGMTAADLRVLDSFGKFVSGMGGGQSGFSDPALDKVVGFHGFAVKTSYHDMEGTVVTEVTSVAHHAAPAGIYELPAGLTKSSVPGM